MRCGCQCRDVPEELSEEELSYEAHVFGSREDERSERQERGDDIVSSYFDWNSEDVFIPRLPEKDARGRPTSDLINPEDNVQIKVRRRRRRNS